MAEAFSTHWKNAALPGRTPGADIAPNQLVLVSGVKPR